MAGHICDNCGAAVADEQFCPTCGAWVDPLQNDGEGDFEVMVSEAYMAGKDALDEDILPPMAELARVRIGPALMALTRTCLSGPNSAAR